MAADPTSTAAWPFRLATLERNETRTADKIEAHETHLARHDTELATASEQVAGLRDDVRRLTGLLGKVFWALIGLLITISGTAVTALFTLGHQ